MIDPDIPVRTVNRTPLIYVVPAEDGWFEGAAEDGTKLVWDEHGVEKNRKRHLRLINDPEGLEICDLSRMAAWISQAEAESELADEAVCKAEDALYEAEDRAAAAHGAIEERAELRRAIYKRAGLEDEIDEIEDHEA